MLRTCADGSFKWLEYCRFYGLCNACRGGHINIVKMMIKKGATTWNNGLFGACQGGNMEIVDLIIEKGANDWDYFDISFSPGSYGYGNLQITGYYSSVRTTAMFRDPAAWYHIVYVCDTTQATASNRVKMYVNGLQITSFSTANYPTQNYQNEINAAGNPHYDHCHQVDQRSAGWSGEFAERSGQRQAGYRGTGDGTDERSGRHG